jgi:copper chaperone CopZ
MVVSVTGMDCASCAFGVGERIKKVKGVRDVKAAVILNKFFIYYDPQLVEPSAIKKIIDSTGYNNYITVEKTNQDNEQEK